MNMKLASIMAPLLFPLLAVACMAPPSPAPPTPGASNALPAESATAPVTPGAQGPAPDFGNVVEYDLGEATVVQERFPEDSRFRNMPVRLNGLIGAPPEGDGPFPVVVIVHGTHPGCPVDEMDVDRWPCDPELEQRNYNGFGYLVDALAQKGYVVLAPNINAENTFGFGEPTPGERLEQLLNLHLQRLAEAGNGDGGEQAFGEAVDLAGRVDLGRLALLGHSRGGDAVFDLANEADFPATGTGIGPVAGILQIAPAAAVVDPWTRLEVPLAAVQAACDGDVVDQSGQAFYEGPRLAPDQSAWATSAWLERANHNGFNTMLPGDMILHQDRADCETLLSGEAQRAWLVDYAGDFLATLFAADPAAEGPGRQRLGIDVAEPAPAALYDLPARVSYLAPAADRQTLWLPAAAEELTTHRLGGAVSADKVVTHFCPKAFYTPESLPEAGPCRRHYVTVPGQPAHAVVSWEEPGAALRFALPEGAGDLSAYTALSLRAAVDPASPLNEALSPQAFSLRLTDRSGKSATVATRPDEPALGFPPGVMEDDPAMMFDHFTGRVPLTTLRLPLGDFAGVDLRDIAEIALLFDRTASGTLFLSDLEWVSQP